MRSVPALTRSSRTRGQDLNPDWNGIWYARTRLTPQGWTAEVAIPFQTLSFAPGQTVWGFNVQRMLKRNNEEAVWAGYRQNLDFFRVSEAGMLTGLANISQGLGLDVSPFFSAIPRRGATNFQPGLNAFYKLTPGLTLSVTLNTDFGETVVDDSQINLTRFSLFFPEKRQFFLEDAGNFAVDDLTGTSRPLVMVPFFSRRIGLDEDGKATDLLGGVKLSGRTGPYRLGIMSVQAQQREPVPGENFSVIRVKRDLFTKSSVGFIATRRTPERGPASGLAGGDFRYSTSELGGNKNLSWSAFFLKSFIPGATRDMAWGTALNMPNDTWELATSYHEVQEDFDATMGFVRRYGIRRFRWSRARRAPPEALGHPPGLVWLGGQLLRRPADQRAAESLCRFSLLVALQQRRRTPGLHLWMPSNAWSRISRSATGWQSRRAAIATAATGPNFRAPISARSCSTCATSGAGSTAARRTTGPDGWSSGPGRMSS